MGNTPCSAQNQSQRAQHHAVLRLFEQAIWSSKSSWAAETSIDNWKGVKLDAEGNVIEVVAPFAKMKGQLDNTIMEKLGTLLPRLKVLNLYGHMLTGACSLDALPPQMELLCLQRDQKEDGKGLSGTLDTSKMPATLKYLALSNNNFSGIVDWEPLSRLNSLKTLWLAGNPFEGTPQLQHLPRSLTHFSIQHCNFSGTANLSELPSGITVLYLYGNPLLSFMGDVSKFPLGLTDGSKEKLKQINVMMGSGLSDGLPDAEVVDGDEFMRRAIATRGGGLQPSAVRRLFCSVGIGLRSIRPMSWTVENSIDKWEGVKLDGEGNVIEVFAQGTKMEGQLNNDVMNTLGTLLPHLKVLDLTGHMLSGPCSLDALPPQLEALGLERDKKELGQGLTGTLDTSKLPATLKCLSLENNNFSGIVDWEPLSRLNSLKTLWLAGNPFEGTPQLQHLPRSPTHFSIQNCNFSGTAHLSKLPSGITEMYLDGNRNLELVGDVHKFPLALDDASKEALKEISIRLNAGGTGASLKTGDDFYRLVLLADERRLLRGAGLESDVNRVAELENRIRQLEQQNEQSQMISAAQSARADAEAARAAGLERELKLSQEENRRLEAQIERFGDLVQQDGAPSAPSTAAALPATGGPAPAGPTLDQVAASQQEASTVSQPSTGSRATTRSINGSDGGADLAAAIGTHFPDLVRNNNADVVHEMQQQQSNG